ncbi:hypothetical protein [Pseudomonas sp. NGC7]|uniref:hypothetical protein n=1 Tax=Pseudomonas sp. NGC7 TaxID=3341775 RepID=UPI00399C4BF7
MCGSKQGFNRSGPRAAANQALPGQERNACQSLKRRLQAFNGGAFSTWEGRGVQPSLLIGTQGSAGALLLQQQSVVGISNIQKWNI